MMAFFNTNRLVQALEEVQAAKQEGGSAYTKALTNFNETFISAVGEAVAHLLSDPGQLERSGFNDAVKRLLARENPGYNFMM